MKIKTILFSTLIALTSIPCFADATSAVAKRVGPVSYYGALHTSGSDIIGAKNNKPVMLRGISLFWSDGTGLPYYNKDAIAWAVNNLGIDVFRFAMGIQYYNSQGNATEPLEKNDSYMGDPEGYKSIVDKMVSVAVENDIYIIIDWHSHRAENEQSAASAFFKEIAAKYSKIPNVIFEIYNEPVHTGWSTIKSYANAVSSEIRKSTDNLILVGTPSWSQMGNYGGVKAKNVAYVLHFYAASHSVDTYGSRAKNAIKEGYPVFISEWGTTKADGAGEPSSSATQDWISFMESNKISNCNWSFRQTNEKETSAMFDGSDLLTSQTLLDAASFSTSGKLVSNYLKKYKRTWADSLTKGKRNGSCAFAHQTAFETESQISSALKSSCTYTSSNPSVAEQNGSNISIKSPGFTIFEGNDGTQTVVYVKSLPSQTIPNFVNLTCRYGGSCSINRSLNFSGNSANNYEWILSITGTSEEGGKFTLKSLNPEIVDAKTAKCTSYSCSNGQSKADAVYMYEFKQFGTAQITASIAAVTGYKETKDTITVTYLKGLHKIDNTFRNAKVGLGETLENFLPKETTKGFPVTYTFEGKTESPYLTVNGTSIIAGNQNALVMVTAHVAETDLQEELEKNVILTIGDSASAVNKDEFQAIQISSLTIPFRTEMQKNGILLNIAKQGKTELNVYSLNGKSIMHKSDLLSAGSHWISMESLPAGSYYIKVRQGNIQHTIQWDKQ